VRCHSCGTEVHEGQKFCAECGASLRGVADVTGEVPVVESRTPLDATTRELATVPPPRPTRSSGEVPRAPVAPTTGRVDVTAPVAAAVTMPAATGDLHVVEATSPPVDLTAPLPVLVPTTGELPVAPPPEVERRAFRTRPMLILALVAAGATVVAVSATVVRITPPPDGAVPRYTVNGLGTNNTVAGLLAAGAMILGALVWCTGRRWGAGLAGGAGASLAGWAALLIGLTEWRIQAAPSAAVARSIGFWALFVAGVLGAVVLVGSLARAGRGGRAGLDPWIAALAAVSFVIAAVGPLIPRGTADWSGNWSTESLGGVDLPPAFFVGRAVQLGLLLLCGVIGCLLVRRWGLGLAVGGALSAGWLLVTDATNRTASPIGPAYANPGAGTDLSPHGVTVVGFAMAGFFTLVAVVMALLDADR
jgi:zinc-ribbon domain